MQLIEQLFGLAPDGGNGCIELGILTVPLILTLLAYRWRGRSKNDCA